MGSHLLLLGDGKRHLCRRHRADTFSGPDGFWDDSYFHGDPVIHGSGSDGSLDTIDIDGTPSVEPKVATVDSVQYGTADGDNVY